MPAIPTSIFKAYDIRGRFPAEINEGVVRAVANALVARWRPGTVVIAHDARTSSPNLYRALTSALRTGGSQLKIRTVGLSTTPMLYFFVNHYKAVGGIMITASHNPPEYNGLKVVGRGALPISGKELYELVV